MEDASVSDDIREHVMMGMNNKVFCQQLTPFYKSFRET